MSELEKMLKAHDWYFDYADDHSAWLKGNRQRQAILAALKEIPIGAARTLWRTYAPENFSFPIRDAA